jgi:HlyD family secretion protein
MADQTRTEIDRLIVRTPKAAETSAEFKVLQVNVRPGEYVGTVPGQAMIVLGFVGRLHVRVDIDENDIGRFRPNLPGTAKPRGAPGVAFPIRFVRVEPYVIPKRSLTGGSQERVDTRVLQVIYRIETGEKPLYVGQQMDVFLDAGE